MTQCCQIKVPKRTFHLSIPHSKAFISTLFWDYIRKYQSFRNTSLNCVYKNYQHCFQHKLHIRIKLVSAYNSQDKYLFLYLSICFLVFPTKDGLYFFFNFPQFVKGWPTNITFSINNL